MKIKHYIVFLISLVFIFSNFNFVFAVPASCTPVDPPCMSPEENMYQCVGTSWKFLYDCGTSSYAVCNVARNACTCTQAIQRSREVYATYPEYENPPLELSASQIDINCCDTNTYCVWKNVCYKGITWQSVPVDSDNDDKLDAYCYSDGSSNGKWRDCDASQLACSSRCKYLLSWNLGGGDANADGGYSTTRCCGDDAGEYKKTGYGFKRCCNSNSDQVDITGACCDVGGIYSIDSSGYCKLDNGQSCTDTSQCMTPESWCSSGHCCADGDKWDPNTGRCEQADICYSTPCGYTPSQYQYWSDSECFLPYLPNIPAKACCAVNYDTPTYDYIPITVY